MTLQSDFQTFLSDIEPSKTTVDQISAAHKALRDYLSAHEHYGEHCVHTYLSGSYAKHTSIRPAKNDDNRDVDIIVETDYGSDANSANVIIELRDILLGSSKYATAHLQTHSVGISFSNLDIDVVPLAVDDETCFIGCVDDGRWTETNPKGHIEWSTAVNAKYDGRFKPVVKIMKWWRRENCPEEERWPKGITLEKIIADHYPDDVTLYEDIVTQLMENIADSYDGLLADGIKPQVVDPSLTTNDLASGYQREDFEAFVRAIHAALALISEEGSTNSAWRKILGNRFPASSRNEFALSPAYLSTAAALSVPHRKTPPWPMACHRPGVIVVADVTYPDGKCERITTNDRVIPKKCEIDYKVLRPLSLATAKVKWQVVNTGAEAQAANQPRGEFNDSNIEKGGRHESTAYRGRHYVQCFLIKNGRCVALSKEFFINVE